MKSKIRGNSNSNSNSNSNGNRKARNWMELVQAQPVEYEKQNDFTFFVKVCSEGDD